MQLFSIWFDPIPKKPPKNKKKAVFSNGLISSVSLLRILVQYMLLRENAACQMHLPSQYFTQYLV